ncbi:hypothetical protein L8648_001619 [Campylobacter lari]|nr:hypothetical protein [Campylobacter lari]EIV5072307.1 hypothetical protein [Campylobacter lari]
MNNKFNFAKFVLDCFACCGLTIISYFVFFLPIIYLIRFIYLIGINMDILNGFGDHALLFTLCHIAFFTIWFLLEKRNIIKYKIHKLSFWIVFAFANSFWWYLAYWLANGGFHK